MFEPDTILATVRGAGRGTTVSRQWHIFRAINPRFLPSGIVATLLTTLLLIIISGVSRAAGGPYVNIGLIAGLALLVGVIVGLLVWGKNKNALLIVTPDGFVQHTNKRTSITVSFLQVVHMEMSVKTGHRSWLWQHFPLAEIDHSEVLGQNDSATMLWQFFPKEDRKHTPKHETSESSALYESQMGMRMQGALSEVQLKLCYLDGHEVVWCPANVFGSTLDIVPCIYDRYMRYVAHEANP